MELALLPEARESPLCERGVLPPRDEGVLGHSCSPAFSTSWLSSESFSEEPVIVRWSPLPTGSWRRREGGFCSVTCRAQTF